MNFRHMLCLFFFSLIGTLGFGQLGTSKVEDHIYIDFVGSGDIQKSISQGTDFNANTGVGVIFERCNGPGRIIQSFELEGVINIASTVDSISASFKDAKLQNSRDFGSYVLNPVSQRQSLYLNSNVYFGELNFLTREILSGVNVRLISSNNVWAYRDSLANLGALAFRIGLFHEFVPARVRKGKTKTGDEGRNKYSIILGLNYSYRGILGDIKSQKNDELREKILDSPQTSFHGLEMNFGFRLNNLRAEFQMPILNAQDQAIDGLTNTQFLFSIKFVGGFSLKLND
ncbi:MAG: hypothetical protein AAF985_00410 [Bacteroidota bacterium]